MQTLNNIKTLVDRPSKNGNSTTLNRLQLESTEPELNLPSGVSITGCKDSSLRTILIFDR